MGHLFICFLNTRHSTSMSRYLDLIFTSRFEEENFNGGYDWPNVSFSGPVFILPQFHLLRGFYFLFGFLSS